MHTYKWWLTTIILLTVLSFLAVFKPLTFSPRKDSSDASLYLRSVTSGANWKPQDRPKEFVSFARNVNLYVYKPQHDLKLGLDLRGGMRVVLEAPDRAEFKYVLASPLASTDDRADKQRALNDILADKLGEETGKSMEITVNTQDVTVITYVKDSSEAEGQLPVVTQAMTDVFKSADAFTPPKMESVYKPVDAQVQDNIRDIMVNRLNSMGTSEITGYPQGQNQIVLEIPGVKDPDDVRTKLRTTAKLRFMLLDRSITVGQDIVPGRANLLRGSLPISSEEALKSAILVSSGSDLSNNCDVTYDSQHQPAVSFSMRTPEAIQNFANVTAANSEEALGPGQGRHLAIVLDNEVISAPVIKSRIDGEGIISGGFAEIKDANSLATLLNAGAMPVPVKIVENRVVSATLGADSVSLSLKAGIVGLVLVLVFMFAYYRLPGLMADLALLIYIVLSLGVLWLFDATLTLPGIAGIIISIGMAVDANVIIFERLKEELRTQKPLETAIDVAFSRAWTAIIDSNVASLITGSVLWMLGTGAVKGFAITLIIGVAVSLFTAVTVTRLFMKLMIRTKAGHNLAWYGV